MSIVNMYQRVDEARRDASKMSSISSDVEQSKQKLIKMNEDIGRFHERIACCEDKCKTLTDKVSGKANSEDLTIITTRFEREIEAIRDEMITKQVFKDNLDEVSMCLQEYVLSNATPRPAVVDTRFDEFEQRLKALSDDVIALSDKLNWTQPPEPEKSIVMRQVFDASDVPDLKLPEKLFKRPEKKK